MHATIPAVTLGGVRVIMPSTTLDRRTCNQCPITLFWNHICIYTISKDIYMKQVQWIYLTLYGHKHDFVQGNKPLCRLYYSSDNIILKLKWKKIQFPVFSYLTKYNWMLRSPLKGALKRTNSELYNLSTPLLIRSNNG